MLRKILALGALALVAVAFGVGPAAASPNHGNSPAYGQQGDGFSDGRLG
jgi:hypothetical protein